MSGYLYLVVGPSGAGKDSLLDAARTHFKADRHLQFPRRYITRGIDAGGEDHIALSEDEFEQLKREGAFAFYWGAHDLKYGIPSEIDGYLELGCNVIVNVSRGVIEFVRERYDNVKIISVVVDIDVLEKRLRARGRESDVDIQRRLDRAKAFRVQGSDVIEINNSKSLADAINIFNAVVARPVAQEKSA